MSSVAELTTHRAGTSPFSKDAYRLDGEPERVHGHVGGVGGFGGRFRSSITERQLPKSSVHGPRRRAIPDFLASCYDGVLRAPNTISPPPFEITLETPQQAPVDLQVEAFNAALLTILAEYRNLQAYGQHL